MKSGGFGGTWYNNDNSGNSSGGQPTSRSNDVLDGSGRNSNSFHMQPPSVDTEEYQYKSVNVAADADAKLRNRSERSNTISSGAFGGGKNSINELLESDKDRQLRKIDNLKNLSGSKVLREEGRWQEWEAGNGATFYVCLVPDSVTGDLKQPFGGQWDKPRVFEVADDPSKRTLSSAVTPGNDRKIVEVLNRRQHEISSLCKLFA